MFTSAPFPPPPPPLLPSFPTFAATLAPFPSPLFLPLLHPRPFPPPPFADQNQLSPSFLLELFSPPPPFIFRCQPLFFFSTILIRSKEFLPPRYAFSYLISVCTDLPVRIFFVGCIHSGKFFIVTCQQERFHTYADAMLL